MVRRLLLCVLALGLVVGCRGRQVRDDGPPQADAHAGPTQDRGQAAGIPLEEPTEDVPQTILDLQLGDADSAAFAEAWGLNRLDVSGHEIPVVINDEVIRWMVYFTGSAHSTFEVWLARSGRWRAMMQSSLAAEGLPPDLFYMSMIESGFNALAVSPARACGLWQFMRPTGRQMSLAIDRYVDERFDPEKATVAAARYLQYLFGRFGDWHLSLAAYNGGEGRVGGAISRTGTADYWELCRAKELPRETCEYVPRYLAALILSENAAHFGFEVELEAPIVYDRVEVPGGVALQIVAECTETECSLVESLNPELRRPFTPPGVESWVVRVPLGTAEVFAERFAALPKDQLRGAIHVVASGETLSHIARRYGVTVDDLMRANGIRDARRLQIGQELTVPGMLVLASPSKGGASASASAASSSPPSSSKKPAATRTAPPPRRPVGPAITHSVKSGESLWIIANRYGVTVDDLKSWNDLDSSALAIGQTLKVHVARGGPERKHTVVAGETLGHIALANGVSVADLKAWNGLGSDAIAVGQVLVVGAGEAQASPAVTVATRRYTVTSGDSLWSIARANDVRVDDLRRWNALKSDSLRVGQVLEIRAPVASGGAFHTVQAGDSLWSVSREYGIEVSSLRRWNGLQGDTLHPGDRLKLGP